MVEFSWIAILALAAGADPASEPQAAPADGETRSLRAAADDYFLIGVGVADRIPRRPHDWELLVEQFASVTPENCMKPAQLQPAEGQFNFELADQFVEFARQHELTIVGHTLVWARDENTPAWFYRDGDEDASCELLLERLRDHIHTVVGRYRGQIAAWDVINEALGDGPDYVRPSGWSRICGEQFIAAAFRYAHEADPDAILIYNDYNNERPEKREKMVRLVRSLQEQNVPIHAIGLQGHYELGAIPLEEIAATLDVARELGVKVVISELDLDVIPRARWWADDGRYRDELRQLDPYPDGLPPELLEQQADEYAALFALLRRNADVVERVTFWNLHDGQSWLNYFPWRRTNHPLLFDRQRQPKPALDGVLEALR